MAEHAPGPDDQPHRPQVLAGARGPSATTGSLGRACRRSATVAASRASARSSARSSSVAGATRARPARAAAPALERVSGREEQLLGDRGLDDPGCVPPHAEVTLDRALAPQHLDDLAVQRRLLGVGRHDRVDVGGRPADVDDHHVAGAGHVVRSVSEELDPGQDGVRRRRPHQPPELRSLGESLAADHVPDEHLADRAHAPATGRARRSAAGRWRSGRAVRLRPRAARTPRPAQRRCRPRRRAPSAAPTASAAGVVQEHLGVAAVGPADQQDDVRAGRRAAHARRRRPSAPADTCDDPRPGREPDPRTRPRR